MSLINVIGIDPSLSGTALYNCKNFKTDSYLLINTKKEIKKNKQDKTKNKSKKMSIEEFAERLQREQKIFDETYNFLNNKEPDYVAIEGYSFMGSNLAIQAEVTGIIGLAISKYKILKRNCRILIFTPQSLKKYITGKGSGQKQLILKEVYKKYGEDIDDDNVADAFVLSQMASEFAFMEKNKRFRKCIKSYQIDIFKNLFFSKNLVKEILKEKR